MEINKVLKGEIEINSTDTGDIKQQLRDLKSQRDIFEALLHVVPEGILVLNSGNQVVFINQIVKKYLNLKEYDSFNNFKGSFLWEIFESTKNLDFLSYHREIELLDPALKYFSVSCFPFEVGNEEPLRVYFIKDITSEKLNAQSSNVNPNFIDNLTFGAGIAHELGNPIAGLSLHAQLLGRLLNKESLDKEDKEQLKTSVSVLNKELSRLDETVHEFLDAVRPTNPQFKVYLMSKVIDEVIKTLIEKAKKMKVELSFESLEDETFLFDPGRMKQALTNLILNAIEVSLPHSRVNITLLYREDFCEIHVQDFGKGIDPSEIGKIFDPYYTTKESGNGLGLLITYRIIRDHGGNITVKSRPSKGTTFVMSLPVRRKAVKHLPKQ